jgi:hypothetical protein
MASIDNKARISSDCIIKSVGVCAMLPSEKHSQGCVFVAYTLEAEGGSVRIIPIKLQTKKEYSRDDILSAIADAESAKRVTYVDFNGTDKDIYVCRPCEGKIFDIVKRDAEENRFVDGFAEIEASHLKFSTPKIESVKLGVPFVAEVEFDLGAAYEADGYEYALINAYNACLLGRAFSRHELQLETKHGQRAKYEVRSVISSKYVDASTIYIKPVYAPNGVISHYLTEQIGIIDGESESHRSYKISYTRMTKDYNILRQ